MRSMIFALFLTVALAACSADRPAVEETKGEAHSEAAKHEDEAGMLHVKPEMLRDLKITTAEVESRPGIENAMVLGELKVNENAYAELGAPISSRIVRLHAGMGDYVKPGTPLATLQSTELGEARANVITAKAQLELANQTLARKRRLGTERIVAEREVQEAEANAAGAEAELRAARAALRALVPDEDDSSDSSQYVLRSPIAGTVIERSAITGKMVDGEEVLFRVGNLSSLWLTVQAFEREALRIRSGSQVRITLPALPGTSMTGKVDAIGKAVNPESRTVPIRIVLANKDGQLRPGMSATAWITPGGEAAMTITVPAAALQRLADEWVVFIPAHEEGEFEVRKVGRGRDLGGEIEILTGLKAHEKVVVDGAFLLKAEAEKARGEGEEHEH